MAENVLIVRLGALGDVANVMPAVHGLRRARREDRLAWVVEEGAAGLVQMNRDVNDVIVFPRRGLSRALTRPWLWPWMVYAAARFVIDLRLRRFTRTLDFQGNLKSGLMAWLTGAPWRAGLARRHGREGNHLFQNVHVPLPGHPISRRERALLLARALAPDAQPGPPNLRAGHANATAVHPFLNQIPPGPRVVIHPGASPFGRFKRWPAERFGLVARRLAQSAGAKVVVIHGPSEEQAMLDQVLAASEGTAILAPSLTLQQLVVLLREASLFIGADSGPLHVAALLGTPCVAIFGPKNPAIYAPPGATVVRREDLPCSPCAKRTCADPRCLTEIPAEQVLQAALRSLPAAQPPLTASL